MTNFNNYLFFRKIFDKSEKGALNWKSTIKIEDINYKGFTRLNCTDKCIIDFHPWCWKHKKEKENFKLDKDFLTKSCPTPDCNRAFICKIEVFKDGLEQPLELIVDELLMKKILAGGTKNLCY